MKAFFIKLSIFVITLLALQAGITVIYPPELPEEILQLEEQLQNGADIIYLGDSTLTYPAGEVTTVEILQEFLPDHRVGQAAHPAYNLDLYRAYADYIARFERPPEVVIMPINMRSFSPEWDLRPIYQFEAEKTVLSYGPWLSSIFYRPLDTLGGFDPPISQDDFLNAPVFNGQTPVGQVADFERLLGNSTFEAQANDVESAYYRNIPSEDKAETLEASLIYYYMYELRPAHRKIESMLAASRLLKAGGVKPIFYITPINYELGDRILGEAFGRRITENVTLVEDTLRAEQVELLNLVFELEAFYFVDTEHLTENGKARLAEVLAALIEPSPPAPLQTAARVTPTSNRPDATEVEAQAAPPQPAQSPATARPTPTPNQPGAGEAATQATPSPAPSPTTARPTPTPNQPGPTEVEPQAALALPTPTPPASPVPPTPTNTRVIPLALTPSAELGAITGVEFIGVFEPAGNYLIDLYRVWYRTMTDADQPVEVRANIYIPRVPAGMELPVLVYGGGTTGISPECAPLNELRQRQNWGAYHYQMLEYAAQGFIVAWPNGQGFDDAQPAHPYFIAKNQGRTMLDAARAVYKFFEQGPAANLAAEPLPAVFFGGYSSGGHAAFAAKDLAAPYAPDLPVKGVIGHGPTTNVEVLLKENPIFSPYLIYAYRAFFGQEAVDPGRILQDNWLANFDADVRTKCVDDIFRYYSPNARLIYRTEFREALYTDRLPGFLPRFKELLDANSSGLSPEGVHIPALILQGTADTVVTPPSQEQFASALCRLGNQVTYLTYPAVDHTETRDVSFRDVIAWMRTLAEGAPPKSSCSSLIGQ